MCKLRLGVFRQGFLAFTAANGFEAVIQRAKPKRSNRQHVQPPCPRFATALPRLCPNSARLSPTLPRRSPDSPRLSPDSPVLACLYTHECQVACPRLSPRLSPRLFPDSPRLSPTIFSKCAAFCVHGIFVDGFRFAVRISMVFEYFDKLLAFPFRALEGSGVCGSQSSQSSRVEN